MDAGFEFKIPGGGIAGVNAFWRDISDLIQLVDLGPNGLVEDGTSGLIVGNGFTFENVGDATAYGVEFDLSTPLSVIGLPNTGLFANYSLLRSEVNNAFVDLATTPINGQPRFAYNLGLTHEFPAYGLTLGVSYQDQGTETSTFFDQTQTTNVSGNLEAFIEKRFADCWVARLSGSNLADSRSLESEENFDGSIVNGVLNNFEIERQEAQPRIQLTLRTTF